MGTWNREDGKFYLGKCATLGKTAGAIDSTYAQTVDCSALVETVYVRCVDIGQLTSQ